jgi:anti-sigma regulatory factor (Ser/Thr protein kinase)
VAPSARSLPASAAFRHETLFYSDGDHGFLEGTLALVRGAVAREAGVLIAVGTARATALREALGDEAGLVRFANVRQLARNPARIIPVWQEFVREHAYGDREALGIGEPVWPGRSPAELGECERHEALLNVAFDDGPRWHLLCSYDLDGLDDRVLDAAQQAHPLLARDGASRCNEAYAYAHEPPRPFAGALQAPSASVSELAFTGGESLAALRHLISGWAMAQSLGVERTEELVLAVNELAANSIRHGGGAGTLRFWREADTLLCEVQDEGQIDAPLVGRSRPSPEARNGRGMWLVNQLCDLVQIRSASSGSVVRVHKGLP